MSGNFLCKTVNRNKGRDNFSWEIFKNKQILCVKEKVCCTNYWIILTQPRLNGWTSWPFIENCFTKYVDLQLSDIVTETASRHKRNLLIQNPEHFWEVNVTFPYKKKKKKWADVSCWFWNPFVGLMVRHWGFKIQNTQEIKRTLLNWTKQDKTRKFSRKSSFSSYVQHKNRKTNN